MTLKVGLTGGIGSGKSYVADLFRSKFGVSIYNSDDRAKYLMINDVSVHSKIVKAFGDDSYIDDKINVPKFNKILFSSKSKLNLMNSIVIPAVVADFNLYCDDQNSDYVIMESAIISETGTYKNLDYVICVVSDMGIRIKRLLQRPGYTMELASKKIASQTSDADKINISDFVIYNNGENLDKQLTTIHNFLIK